MKRFLLLIAVLYPVSCAKVDDSVQFILKFEPEKTGDDPNDLLRVPKDKEKTSHQIVTVSTRNSESFVCHIPSYEKKDDSARISSYTGPSPAELLKPIYGGKICSYRLETYWSYELCHGRYLVQYHEEKELKNTIRTEYYLGNYQPDYASLGGHGFDQLNPPKKTIDGDLLSYYPVVYKQGTACDITGKPRVTNVLYICDPDGREQIHSLMETSSCVYEAIVLTDKLCSHPAFPPPQRKHFDVVCYDKNGRRDPTPLALQSLNKAHDNTFKQEYAAIEETPVEKKLSAREEEMAKRLDNFFDQMDMRKLEHYGKWNTGSGSDEKPFISIEEQYKQDPPPDGDMVIGVHPISKLLTGKECLQAGEGWWKYEFCYGASVTQFHAGENGERTEVLLGVFDEAIHKAFIEQNDNKKPIIQNGKVQQITQVYVKGDMCQETRAHRSVEVKMRCRLVNNSKTAVSITVEEPSVCRYVMTVESDRLCSIFEYADEYGLIDSSRL